MSEPKRNPAIEVERAVVGGVLVHPRTFVEASIEIALADFYDPAMGAIWSAFEQLDRERRPIDALTTWEQLRHERLADRLTSRGGQRLLTELMTEVVTVENIGYHARLVAKYAERRRWFSTLNELTARAGDLDGDPDLFFDEGEGELLRLLTRAKSGGRVTTSREGMMDATARAEKRWDERDNPRPKGVPTGVTRFDQVSGGMKPGQLIIIGARSGIGKSAFAGNVVESVARASMPAKIFSLEMQNEQWWDRMLASGGVDADRLRTGHLSPDDWKSLTYTAGELGSAPIEIDDEGGITITQLRSRARRWRAHQGRACARCEGEKPGEQCPHVLIVVDYLQRLKSGARREQSKQEVVAECAEGLKELAKELRCPVLALAQLKRDIDGKPTTADIMHSTQIELEADVIALFYREDKVNPECPPEKKGMAQMIIGKGRDMPCITVDLLFQEQYVRFRNPVAR